MWRLEGCFLNVKCCLSRQWHSSPGCSFLLLLSVAGSMWCCMVQLLLNIGQELSKHKVVLCCAQHPWTKQATMRLSLCYNNQENVWGSRKQVAWHGLALICMAELLSFPKDVRTDLRAWFVNCTMFQTMPGRLSWEVEPVPQTAQALWMCECPCLWVRGSFQHLRNMSL